MRRVIQRRRRDALRPRRSVFGVEQQVQDHDTRVSARVCCAGADVWSESGAPPVQEALQEDSRGRESILEPLDLSVFDKAFVDIQPGLPFGRGLLLCNLASKTTLCWWFVGKASGEKV